MKKIGIITILKVNNYGAELQSFALQHKLFLCGYNVEVIDYLFGINRQHNSKGEKLTIPIPIKERIKDFLLPIVEDMRTMFFFHSKKVREEKFLRFHQKFNNLSQHTYPSVKSLYENRPQYDIYCVGSDQVWNYMKGYSILPFLLDFVDSTKKKITYASSIGLSSISNEAANVFKEHLSKFSMVSVRETQASVILSKLLNKPVPTVLDPTLLLTHEEWLSMADYSQCPKEPYLVLYIVTIKPCRYAEQLALYIAKMKNLKVVRIYRDAFCFNPNKNFINLLDAGPSDFIGLFDKSAFVVTNSFHGTVFSINFNKPFYSVVKKGKNTNSRLYSILMKLNKSERLLEEGSPMPRKDNFNCDFVNTNIALEKERMYSIKVLQDAIDI